MMLHNIHKSITTVSQRRHLLVIIKYYTVTASSSSSSSSAYRRPFGSSNFHQHARLFSSLSSSDNIIIKNERTITTTSHDINEDSSPQQILPTRRSGRRRMDHQQQQHNKPLSEETSLEATRGAVIIEETATTVTVEPDMLVMDEEKTIPHAQNEQRRRLDVAIVGLPNAGKSQLLNVLTQSPVAAVSRKRHTTRHGGILGARTVTVIPTTDEKDQQHDDDSSAAARTAMATMTHQLVFVDTPGFMQVSQAKKEGLDGALVSTAANVMQNVDFTLLVVDAAASLATNDSRREAIVALMLQALSSQGRNEEQEMRLLNDDGDDDAYGNDEKHEKQRLCHDPSKYAIVLNKVDLVHPKSRLLDIAIDISSMAKECLKYHHHLSLQAEHDDDNDNDDHEDYRQTRLPLSTKQKIRDISSSSSNVGSSDNTVDKLFFNDNGDDDDDDDDDDSSLQDEMPIFFYISALKQDGVDDLLQHLFTLTTPTYEEWPVEPGQATQLSDLDRVEEIIREKLYRCLHKEVPYAIQQENRLYEKRQVPTTATTITTTASTNPSSDPRQATSTMMTTSTTTTILTIHQDLRVWTKSHRELVRGRGDQTLERIRETATRDLEQVFNCKVQLHLNVKLVKSKN